MSNRRAVRQRDGLGAAVAASNSSARRLLVRTDLHDAQASAVLDQPCRKVTGMSGQRWQAAIGQLIGFDREARRDEPGRERTLQHKTE
jgi:hypothetical protein